MNTSRQTKSSLAAFPAPRSSRREEALNYLFRVPSSASHVEVSLLTSAATGHRSSCVLECASLTAISPVPQPPRVLEGSVVPLPEINARVMRATAVPQPRIQRSPDVQMLVIRDADFWDWRTLPNPFQAFQTKAGNARSRRNNPRHYVRAFRTARNHQATFGPASKDIRADWNCWSLKFSQSEHHVFSVVPTFSGSLWRLITPSSASNSGSLWTSVALSRCAVAATNASAKETLCAAFNFAASPHSASSECSQWTGCCFTQAINFSADSAPCSLVRMYCNSASETNEAWSDTRPSQAAATCASTSSAPGSLSASANQAEVSSTTLSTRPLLGAILQQRLNFFQNRLGFSAHALNHNRIA